MKPLILIFPYSSINRPVLFTTLPFSVFLALILAGCVSQEIVPPPIDPPIPAATYELENFKNQIAHLEQVIAEKDELIKNQQIKQQNQAQALREVNKEATRAQVKLHRLATKPGTASAIAETEVALAHLKQMKISANEQIIQIQAQHLIETASGLYEKDQYAAAMNYVAQAKHLISSQTDPRHKRINMENNMPLEFHAPIKLSTRSAAHLRSAPSNQAKVLTTLKKDTPVAAIASQGSWFRVQINGNEGWILNTMLERSAN